MSKYPNVGPLMAKWASAQEIVCDDNLDAGSKVLGIRLLQIQNASTGHCYPSCRRLANDLGLTERAIRKQLRKLEKAGWLRTAVGKGVSGTNSYRVALRGVKHGTAGAELESPANLNSEPPKNRKKIIREDRHGVAQSGVLTEAERAKKRADIWKALEAEIAEKVGLERCMSLDKEFEEATNKVAYGIDFQTVCAGLLQDVASKELD